MIGWKIAATGAIVLAVACALGSSTVSNDRGQKAATALLVVGVALIASGLIVAVWSI